MQFFVYASICSTLRISLARTLSLEQIIKNTKFDEKVNKKLKHDGKF